MKNPPEIYNRVHLMNAGSEKEIYPENPNLLKFLALNEIEKIAGDSWQEVEPPSKVGSHVSGDVFILFLQYAYYLPSLGLLIDSKGRIVSSTHREANNLGTMNSIKKLINGITGKENNTFLEFGKNIPEIESASIWMNYGSIKNYGHFLFDALPALYYYKNAGILANFPAISPELKNWQSDLLSATQCQSIGHKSKIVRVKRAVVTSCMNHYLHRPGILLLGLREIFEPRPSIPWRMIYLSRRGYYSRIMVNEAELEFRLRQIGFEIHCPEKLSIAEQIRLFQCAKILIGASGAALANIIFMPKSSTLIEIRPSWISEPWLSASSKLLGLNHIVTNSKREIEYLSLTVCNQIRQLPRVLLGKKRGSYLVDSKELLNEVRKAVEK